MALDDNFDGFVTVQDFMKHFGTDRTVEYDDLMKLLRTKDRNGEGRIDFGDFSKWFGSFLGLTSMAIVMGLQGGPQITKFPKCH